MFHLRALTHLLLFTAPAFAAWTPPDAGQLARLERALAPQHAQYDPAEQLIRRPFSTPGYHTTLKGGMVHPTKDSFAYALGLLDTGKPDDLARAAAILRRGLSLQDTDPNRRTYGIWSWYLEEPLDRMSPPDWNWADFNGAVLVQVLRDHRDRLAPDLAAAVAAGLRHAGAAIVKRNVGPGYTNIAILGTYVTLVGGEVLGDADLRDYGLGRLRRIHAHLGENGTFEEYNSPTYTVIALQELSRLQAHATTPEARPLLDQLVHKAWEELASHFHAPTRQWAGPHSRAYRSLAQDSLLALIQRGTAGRVAFGVDVPDREERRLPLACPPDLEPLFAAPTAPRTVTETFIRRTQTVGTTYLHPQYALGTVNRGDLWNQRRALLLHFGTATRPGYVQLRFLKDGYDFSSAILTSAQRAGTAVGTVHLITDGGDTHISLDKVKQGTIRARDLRVRFEVGGPAAAQATVNVGPDGQAARLQLGDLPVAIRLAYARFGRAAPSLTTGRDAERAWVDVVFHEGDERTFALATLEEAVAGFVFAVGPAPVPTAAVKEGRLEVQAEGLAVRAPVRPGPRS